MAEMEMSKAAYEPDKQKYADDTVDFREEMEI